LILMAFFEELGLSRNSEDYRGSCGIYWDHRGLFWISWGDMEQARMNYGRDGFLRRSATGFRRRGEQCRT
jgi:hypothetical protein